jgi:hypothetical protein
VFFAIPLPQDFIRSFTLTPFTSDDNVVKSREVLEYLLVVPVLLEFVVGSEAEETAELDDILYRPAKLFFGGVYLLFAGGLATTALPPTAVLGRVGVVVAVVTGAATVGVGSTSAAITVIADLLRLDEVDDEAAAA